MSRVNGNKNAFTTSHYRPRQDLCFENLLTAQLNLLSKLKVLLQKFTCVYLRDGKFLTSSLLFIILARYNLILHQLRLRIYQII